MKITTRSHRSCKVNGSSRSRSSRRKIMCEDDFLYDWELNGTFEKLASKQVEDADGFYTDYTMYRNTETGEYVFVFGDADLYSPEDGDYDWVCDNEDEAWEWFSTYLGFADEDDDDIYSSTSITASRRDNYFGEQAAFQYGDDIVNTLGVGATISKRKDLADAPGGLHYEADKVGIDMFDLLEALEGMCADGRVSEIDDSTYEIVSDKRHPVRSLFYNEAEDENNIWSSQCINCATELTDDERDELLDIVDKYNTSKPVSGDWATETVDEQKTIASHFNISMEDAKQIMIDELGFSEEEFDGSVEGACVKGSCVKGSYGDYPEYINGTPTTANANYYYITKHGVGPGTLPNDVEVNYIIDLPNHLTSFYTDRFLTTDELNQYDIYPETHDVYQKYPDWIRQTQEVNEDEMYDDWQKGRRW